MSLPHSVRSYIDSFADEFSYTDRWTKIAQIAYRLKRGADLLPEFEEDIKRHMEDPQYGYYENTAKSSIATYIEALRTNNEQDISFLLLPEIMTFAKMFQLLTEEILYRYSEVELEGNKVECKFDKVHFDYEEIAERYDGLPLVKSKREFRKYISTSKETLRNIEVNKN